MRIIAGKYKFRQIRPHSKINFKPILSSIRESIFNILHFRLKWNTAVVADVFTGSGILGLEALSRGAQFCHFNDLNSANIQNLQHYLKKLAISNATTHNLPYQQFLLQCHQQSLKLNLVFITPPYDQNAYSQDVLQLLFKYRLLTAQALIVVQTDRPTNFSQANLVLYSQKKYGRTHIAVYGLAAKTTDIARLKLNHQKLLIISGPSGVGKKTVIQKLLADPVLNLGYSVSCTTRPQRSQETDHVDYHFLSKAAFATEIRQNNFLEYAQYVNHFYGTSQIIVQRLLDQKKNVLLEIEILGALIIKKQYPQAIWIYIYPPNFDELEQRMQKRGRETKAEMNRRLEKTRSEMQYVFTHNVCDIYVENNKVTEIVREIKAFLTPKLK